MIKVRHLYKAFGEKKIFEDFSCSFSEGKVTCVMGASGCGKTTLLQILLGLEAPDSGEILGIENQKVSAVFQENRLCENVSAISNIRLVNKGLSKSSAIDILESLGLSDSTNLPVRTLSGGMRRRVALARALSAPYTVLFLDEPFKGLDENTKETTINYFLEKTRGKTVILVTHDLAEAEMLGEIITL